MCIFFVSGWDLVYDNGFIEIDPTQCGYTTFLGAGIPEAEGAEEEEEDDKSDKWKRKDVVLFLKHMQDKKRVRYLLYLCTRYVEIIKFVNIWKLIQETNRAEENSSI